MDTEKLITFTADIVSAHVANNPVPVDQVAGLIARVSETLASLGTEASEPPAEKVPVVSVRASVKPDYIVCMECGKKQKTLKRHLQTEHGMTPDQYRTDYGLPSSYPMVAPNYSERRRELAKSHGLGRKQRESPAPETGERPKSAGRGRKPAKGATGKRAGDGA